MSRFPIPWDFALILLVLAVLVPWRGAVKMRQLLARPAIESADRLALYASTIAFQWIGAILVLWRSLARNLDLHSLGIAAPNPLLVASVAAGLSVLLVINQLFALRRLAHSTPTRSGFVFQMAAKILPQNPVETLVFVALVATVALCEEVIYRGFALTVLSATAQGSLLIGAAGSSLLFAAAHAYQGRRGMVTTFLAGLLFAAVRIWTGSLTPSIAGHLCADLVAGLVAPRFLRAQVPPSAEDHPVGGR